MQLSFCFGMNDTSLVQHKKEHLHLSYSGGLYAPFGIMTGCTFAKGKGFYVSARFNQNILHRSQYYFDGSAINDRSLYWVYNDKQIYSRWEVNAGLIFRLFKKESGNRTKFYVGAGLLKPKYLYSYKKSTDPSIGNVWVEYKEVSKLSYNTDMGLCFFINKSLHLQLGCSAFTKRHEWMITFGIGTGLYKFYK